MKFEVKLIFAVHDLLMFLLHLEIGNGWDGSKAYEFLENMRNKGITK